MSEETADLPLLRAELGDIILAERDLHGIARSIFPDEEIQIIEPLLSDGYRRLPARDAKGLPIALSTLNCAIEFAHLIDPDRNIMLAIMLQPLHAAGMVSDQRIQELDGDDVLSLRNEAGDNGLTYLSATDNDYFHICFPSQSVSFSGSSFKKSASRCFASDMSIPTVFSIDGTGMNSRTPW